MNQFCCNECKYQSNSARDVEIHFVNSHGPVFHEVITELTSQTESEPERCGYCGLNLDKYQDHDVHRCKHGDDYCRYCDKYIAEIDSYKFDPNYGAFCSTECKEAQYNK